MTQRVRVPRTVGKAGGLLGLSIVVYALVGVVWGPLRPALHGTVDDSGSVIFDMQFNVEFISFIEYCIIVMVLSIALAIIAFQRLAALRGSAMVWWVTLCAAVSSLALLLAGQTTANLRYPAPKLHQLNQGDHISYVPGFDPTVGIVAAAFLAALSYWLCILITPAADSADSAEV